LEKSPEYDRIKAMLDAGETPSDDDWNWINKYLQLADKARGVETPVPFRPRPTPKKSA
jgi:hypothetical protein